MQILNVEKEYIKINYRFLMMKYKNSKLEHMCSDFYSNSIKLKKFKWISKKKIEIWKTNETKMICETVRN